MKLRNKKTGEIVYVEGFGSTEYEIQMTYRGIEDDTKLCLYTTDKMTTFNAEWEDYEEPVEVWYIDYQGLVRSAAREENDWFKENEIGNYFETKEEAEKAVEKLKAWKRLKDKGFKFGGVMKLFDGDWYKITFNKDQDETWVKDNKADLDLLFGGEE